MKTFTSSYEFPATVEQMISWITTEEYLHAKYTDMDAQNLRIHISENTDEVFTSRVERDVLLREKVPAFAKKLVKEVMTVAQEISWNKQGDIKTGSFSAEIPGMNGHVTADIRLENTANPERPSRIVFDGKIDVSIPLIGGKLESLMAESAEEKIAADLSATNRYVCKKMQ